MGITINKIINLSQYKEVQMGEIFALEDIFNVMIELESLGHKHYNKLQTMTDDLTLRELFKHLACEELDHKELYTSYKKKSISFSTSKVDNEYMDYIAALLKGTIQFLNNSQEIDSFDQGFDIAVNLEKDTILFLSELRRIIDSAYYDAIDNIMDQERAHLKALYEYNKK